MRNTTMPESPRQPRPATLDTRTPTRLLVDGAPYLVRGIELHNSTASDPAELARALRTATDVGANTVLASVSWELVEPDEGVFDFGSIDMMLSLARSAEVKLVLLWFGAWKNGASTYAPPWVLRDTARFERAALHDGTLTSTLTPFGATSLDATAFARFVQHIEEVDAHERTTIMIQIENEIGLLGAARDHSDAARRAWSQEIPAAVRTAVTARLGSTDAPHTRWSDLPSGDDADEAFMAFGYARHVEQLAAAGRSVTDLPFYVNAWLDRTDAEEIDGIAIAGGGRPGEYPSGGPLPRVADVWRTTAPTVDLLAPDLYFGDPHEIFTRFLAASGGLFVPEQRRDAVGVGHAWLAVAEYAAIGVSPFGVDSAVGDELDDLRDAYATFAAIGPHLLERTTASRGFLLTDRTPEAEFHFDDMRVRVTRAAGIGSPLDGLLAAGAILRDREGTFLFAGRGFRAAVESLDPDATAEIERVEELRHAEGGLVVARRLNGDETAGGTGILHPPLRRPMPTAFPIPTAHGHTGISSCRVFLRPRLGDEPR